MVGQGCRNLENIVLRSIRNTKDLLNLSKIAKKTDLDRHTIKTIVKILESKELVNIKKIGSSKVVEVVKNG